MKNTYRVDTVRHGSTTTPCGMNSIRYLGDSLPAARRALAAIPTGVTPWNVPDAAYGLLLSRWDGQAYVAVSSR